MYGWLLSCSEYVALAHNMDDDRTVLIRPGRLEGRTITVDHGFYYTRRDEVLYQVNLSLLI